MVEFCPPFDFNTALTFWVGTVAQGIVIVVGLIGNTLILLVYSSAEKNDSSNLAFLVRTLAVCDGFQLFIVIFYNVLRFIFPYTGALRWYYTTIVPFMVACALPLWFTSQLISAYVLVYLTYERYINTCKPEESHKLGPVRVWRTFVAIVIFAVIWTIPRYLTTTVRYEPVPPECALFKGQVIATNVYRPFTDQLWYYVFYDGVFYTLVVWVVPSVLMLYWNILTLRSLGKHGGAPAGQREGRSITSLNRWIKEHSSETLMVMGASFTYILLELPDAWLSTITLWINITNYQVFSDLFILIICASNAIIYSILGEKFRADLGNSVSVRMRRLFPYTAGEQYSNVQAGPGTGRQRNISLPGIDAVQAGGRRNSIMAPNSSEVDAPVSLHPMVWSPPPRPFHFRARVANAATWTGGQFSSEIQAPISEGNGVKHS